MSNSKMSIAGVAHGAKPAAPGKSTRRYYPQLDGLVHPEVARAITTLFDNIYEQRDGTPASGGGAGKTGETTSADKSKSGDFVGNIQGIQIKAPTDPSSLKEGATLVYNSKTAQFEFKVPA